MPYFAVHDADGALVSWGTTVADDKTLAKNGYVAVRLTGGDTPPDGKAWNPKTKKFDQAPVTTADPADALADDPEFQAMAEEEQRQTRVLLRALRGGAQ